MAIVKTILGLIFLLLSIVAVIMSDKELEDNKMYKVVGFICLITAIILIGNF